MRLRDRRSLGARTMCGGPLPALRAQPDLQASLSSKPFSWRLPKRGPGHRFAEFVDYYFRRFDRRRDSIRMKYSTSSRESLYQRKLHISICYKYNDTSCMPCFSTSFLWTFNPFLHLSRKCDGPPALISTFPGGENIPDCRTVQDISSAKHCSGRRMWLEASNAKVYYSQHAYW